MTTPAPEFSANWIVEDDTEEDFPAPEVKLDLRTREGRAAAGLPPKEAPNKGQAQPRTVKAPPAKPARVAPVAKGQTDYRVGITGISQLITFGLAFSNPADAQAIQDYTPNIAQALHDLAIAKPEVARVLDKLLAAGPYGALIAAVFPLIIQILINHNKLPDAVGSALGLV